MTEINTITSLINNMQAFVNEATNINANDNLSFDLKIERLTALSEKYDLAN
jgi:hypothetical protein